MNDKEIWDKFWRHGGIGVTPTRKKLFKRFKEIKLTEKAKILDVGCGSGTLAHFWKKQGYDVTGLDISDKSIEITRSKGVYCVKGDVTKRLLFEENTFDLVYSDGLLEHFVDPKPVLAEIFRVSGRYVLTMVPRNTLYNIIVNIITRTPREYKKSEHEWVELHEDFCQNSLKFGIVWPGTLMILCEKGDL